MSIFVNVVGQKMTATSSTELIVEGSQNFVKIKFNLSSDWDNLSVFAQFIQSGVSYNKYLDEENSVFLPIEIVSGECKLLLYGTGSTTIGTTNYLTLKIQENLMISDVGSTDISEHLYNQLVNQFNELYNKAKDCSDIASSAATRAESAKTAAETAVEPLQNAIQDATLANQIAKEALNDLESGNYAKKTDIDDKISSMGLDMKDDGILKLVSNGQQVGDSVFIHKSPVVNMIDIQSNIIVEEQGLVLGGNISIILPNSKTVGFGILGGRINSDGSFLPGELYPLLPPYATDGFNGATQIKIAFSVVFEGMKIVFDEALLKQLISNDITAEFIQGVYKSHFGDTEEKQYLFFGIKSDNRDFLNAITTEFSQLLSMGNQMCVSFISFGGESNEQ